MLREKYAPKKLITPKTEHQEVEQFLEQYDLLCVKTHVISEREKCKGLLGYCSPKLRKILRDSVPFKREEFDKVVEDLYYFTTKEDDSYNLKKVRAFLNKWRARTLVSENEFKRYHRKYLELAGKGLQKGMIDQKEFNRHFWEGIHRTLRKKIKRILNQRVPTPNAAIPFALKDVSEVAIKLLNPDSFDVYLDDEDYDSDIESDPETERRTRTRRKHNMTDSEEDSDSDSDDSDPPKRRHHKTRSSVSFSKSALRKDRPTNKQVEEDEVAKITQQLEKLHLLLKKRDQNSRNTPGPSQGQYQQPHQFYQSPPRFGGPSTRFGPPKINNNPQPFNPSMNQPPAQIPQASYNRPSPRNIPPSMTQNRPMGTFAQEIYCFGCGGTGHRVAQCSPVNTLLNQGTIIRNNYGKFCWPDQTFISKDKDETLVQAVERSLKRANVVRRENQEYNSGFDYEYIIESREESDASSDEQTELGWTSGKVPDCYAAGAERSPKISRETRKQAQPHLPNHPQKVQKFPRGGDTVHLGKSGPTIPSGSHMNSYQFRNPKMPTPFGLNQNKPERKLDSQLTPMDIDQGFSKEPGKNPPQVGMGHSGSNIVKSTNPGPGPEQISTTIIQSILDKDITVQFGPLLDIAPTVRRSFLDVMKGYRGGVRQTTGQNDKSQKNVLEADLKQSLQVRAEPETRDGLLEVQVKVGKVTMTGIIDSGSQVNIISEDCASASGLPMRVEPQDKIAVAGIKGTTRSIGRIIEAEICIITNNVQTTGDLWVLKENKFTLILGRPWSTRNYATIEETEKGTNLRFESLGEHYVSNISPTKRCLQELEKQKIRAEDDEWSEDEDKETRKCAVVGTTTIDTSPVPDSEPLRDEEEEEGQLTQEAPRPSLNKVREEEEDEEESRGNSYHSEEEEGDSEEHCWLAPHLKELYTQAKEPKEASSLEIETESHENYIGMIQRGAKEEDWDKFFLGEKKRQDKSRNIWKEWKKKRNKPSEEEKEEEDDEKGTSELALASAEASETLATIEPTHRKREGPIRKKKKQESEVSIERRSKRIRWDTRKARESEYWQRLKTQGFERKEKLTKRTVRAQNCTAPEVVLASLGIRKIKDPPMNEWDASAWQEQDASAQQEWDASALEDNDDIGNASAPPESDTEDDASQSSSSAISVLSKGWENNDDEELPQRSDKAERSAHSREAPEQKIDECYGTAEEFPKLNTIAGHKAIDTNNAEYVRNTLQQQEAVALSKKKAYQEKPTQNSGNYSSIPHEYKSPTPVIFSDPMRWHDERCIDVSPPPQRDMITLKIARKFLKHRRETAGEEKDACLDDWNRDRGKHKEPSYQCENSRTFITTRDVSQPETNPSEERKPFEEFGGIGKLLGKQGAYDPAKQYPSLSNEEFKQITEWMDSLPEHSDGGKKFLVHSTERGTIAITEIADMEYPYADSTKTGICYMELERTESGDLQEVTRSSPEAYMGAPKIFRTNRTNSLITEEQLNAAEETDLTAESLAAEVSGSEEEPKPRKCLMISGIQAVQRRRSEQKARNYEETSSEIIQEEDQEDWEDTDNRNYRPKDTFDPSIERELNENFPERKTVRFIPIPEKPSNGILAARQLIPMAQYDEEDDVEFLARGVTISWNENNNFVNFRGNALIRATRQDELIKWKAPSRSRVRLARERLFRTGPFAKRVSEIVRPNYPISFVGKVGADDASKSKPSERFHQIPNENEMDPGVEIPSEELEAVITELMVDPIDIIGEKRAYEIWKHSSGEVEVTRLPDIEIAARGIELGMYKVKNDTTNRKNLRNRSMEGITGSGNDPHPSDHETSKVEETINSEIGESENSAEAYQGIQLEEYQEGESENPENIDRKRKEREDIKEDESSHLEESLPSFPSTFPPTISPLLSPSCNLQMSQQYQPPRQPSPPRPPLRTLSMVYGYNPPSNPETTQTFRLNLPGDNRVTIGQCPHHIRPGVVAAAHLTPLTTSESDPPVTSFIGYGAIVVTEDIDGELREHRGNVVVHVLSQQLPRSANIPPPATRNQAERAREQFLSCRSPSPNNDIEDPLRRFRIDETLEINPIAGPRGRLPIVNARGGRRDPREQETAETLVSLRQLRKFETADLQSSAELSEQQTTEQPTPFHKPSNPSENSSDSNGSLPRSVDNPIPSQPGTRISGPSAATNLWPNHSTKPGGSSASETTPLIPKEEPIDIDMDASAKVEETKGSPPELRYPSPDSEPYDPPKSYEEQYQEAGRLLWQLQNEHIQHRRAAATGIETSGTGIQDEFLPVKKSQTIVIPSRTVSNDGSDKENDLLTPPNFSPVMQCGSPGFGYLKWHDSAFRLRAELLKGEEWSGEVIQRIFEEVGMITWWSTVADALADGTLDWKKWKKARVDEWSARFPDELPITFRFIADDIERAAKEPTEKAKLRVMVTRVEDEEKDGDFEMDDDKSRPRNPTPSPASDYDSSQPSEKEDDKSDNQNENSAPPYEGFGLLRLEERLENLEGEVLETTRNLKTRIEALESQAFEDSASLTTLQWRTTDLESAEKRTKDPKKIKGRQRHPYKTRYALAHRDELVQPNRKESQKLEARMNKLEARVKQQQLEIGKLRRELAKVEELATKLSDLSVAFQKFSSGQVQHNTTAGQAITELQTRFLAVVERLEIRDTLINNLTARHNALQAITHGLIHQRTSEPQATIPRPVYSMYHNPNVRNNFLPHQQTIPRPVYPNVRFIRQTSPLKQSVAA